MYVGLIVRDECERSVKTQASKNVQVDFVTGSWEAYPQREPHVVHMTGRWRVVPDCTFCEYLASKANQRRTHKTFCLAKGYVLLYHVFTHIIYTLIIHKL